MMTTVFTVGHSTRGLGEFVALLAERGVTRLVDVRRFPYSRRHPHTNRESLAVALGEHGIEYRHAEVLAGHRQPRDDSPHTALDEEAFRGYADHADTPAFETGIRHLARLADERPTAVMCAEASPERCHRRVLSDQLVARLGVRVVHVTAPGEAHDHAVDPRARLVDGKLVYREASLFDGL